MLRRQLFAKAY